MGIQVTLVIPVLTGIWPGALEPLHTALGAEVWTFSTGLGKPLRWT